MVGVRRIQGQEVTQRMGRLNATTIPLQLRIIVLADGHEKVLALVGGQLAHATNESDYRYGYQGGQGEWVSCALIDGEGDCTHAHDYCTNIITYQKM